MGNERRETLDKIRRAGFPCPYKEGGVCTTRCGNHTVILSAFLTTSVVSDEAEQKGKKLSDKQIRELAVNAIRNSMVEGGIKEIDCRPQMPHSQ